MGKPTGKKEWPKTTIYDLWPTFKQRKDIRTDENKSTSQETEQLLTELSQ